jgi:hypothetical protein
LGRNATNPSRHRPCSRMNRNVSEVRVQYKASHHPSHQDSKASTRRKINAVRCLPCTSPKKKDSHNGSAHPSSLTASPTLQCKPAHTPTFHYSYPFPKKATPQTEKEKHNQYPAILRDIFPLLQIAKTDAHQGARGISSAEMTSSPKIGPRFPPTPCPYPLAH